MSFTFSRCTMSCVLFDWIPDAYPMASPHSSRSCSSAYFWCITQLVGATSYRLCIAEHSQHIHGPIGGLTAWVWDHVHSPTRTRKVTLLTSMYRSQYENCVCCIDMYNLIHHTDSDFNNSASGQHKPAQPNGGAGLREYIIVVCTFEHTITIVTYMRLEIWTTYWKKEHRMIQDTSITLTNVGTVLGQNTTSPDRRDQTHYCL